MSMSASRIKSLSLVLFAACVAIWIVWRPVLGVAPDQRASIRYFEGLATLLLLTAVAAAEHKWNLWQRRRLASGIALLLFTLATAGFFVDKHIERSCTVPYDDGTAIIGDTFTPSGAKYAGSNPGFTPETLLFHAGGDAALVWTKDSIERCWWKVFAAESVWAPLAVSAAFLIVQTLWTSRRRSLALPAPAAARAIAELPLIYDAFLSYRHTETDRTFARDILQILEDSGYRIAIDERDFRPQESFVDELERCIRQSRYTLAVVSAEYVESGNCHEEAIISKVLSMNDKRNRLIPLVIQHVNLPAWMYNTVGIDFTVPDALVDPIEKIKATLGLPGVLV
jgi:hypothetical protein